MLLKADIKPSKSFIFQRLTVLLLMSDEIYTAWCSSVDLGAPSVKLENVSYVNRYIMFQTF